MSKLLDSGFDKTYCYPDTNVLKNKFDIRDKEELQKIERKQTSMRIIELKSGNEIPGNFDIIHLKAIHRHIFQDIYEWAGEFRTVNIAKSNMFCNVQFMEEQLGSIFRELHKENCLENVTDREELGKRLGYYISEINAVHPFREGNGRTQRAFIEELAKNAGYSLDYSKISAKEMIKASIASFNCEYVLMQQLITKALSPIGRNSTKEFCEAVEELGEMKERMVL